MEDLKTPVFEIVGTSQVWHDWEDANGICSMCSGTGELATTDRAAYAPEEHPEEIVTCNDCNGTGKRQVASC